MEKEGMTLLTSVGWITGVQAKGEEAEKVLAENAVGLRCEPSELVLIKDCLVQGWGDQRVELVLRRSAVLGLRLG